MGRILGLELQNFKSYKGTCRIGLGGSYFTSIIGPNGAGKSNMMDAISFVLGVQSSHLRSQNLKDLIYRDRYRGRGVEGRDNRANEVNRAHVKVVYEKENGGILQLMRQVNRNGSSEYSINGENVTSLQYSTVLRKENILIKARNFLVFQGDVEQIASQSPRELTKMVETVSGSAEYQQEYDNLKEETEKLHDFSVAVFSRRKTLNTECRQYKEQKAEQETFEKMLLEKNNCVKIMNLYKLFHNEKKYLELRDTIEGLSKDMSRLQKEAQSQEKRYNDSVADYSLKMLEMKTHELKISETMRSVEGKRRELIPIEAKKKSHLNMVAGIKRKIGDIGLDIQKQTKQVERVERELRDTKRLLGNFNDKMAAMNTSDISKNCQNEYDALREQYLQSGGSELEDQLSILLNDEDSVKSKINSLKNQQQNITNRINELGSIVRSDLEIKHNELTTEVNDILGIKSKKIEAKNSLTQKKLEYNNQEIELNTELRDTLQRIDELSSEKRESKRQLKLRDNIRMLKGLLPENSIKGLLCDLVRPVKHKYDYSLATLLGKNAESVVVETASIAYKCIEILKERRSGTATFIPLDSIANESVNLKYLRSLHEDVVPGVDTVEYDDSSLESAIYHVIGDSLVADSIDVARSLRWNLNLQHANKIATIDGSIIHRSGLMTGGQEEQRSGTTLTWDQNELNNLSITKEKLMSKVAELADKRPKEMEINSLIEEINQLDDRLPLLRNQINNLERLIEDRTRETQFQHECADKVKSNIDEAEKKLKKTKLEIKKLHEEEVKLQEKFLSEFCEKYDFDSVFEANDRLNGASSREKARERSQYFKTIDILTNKLNFEKERLEETKLRERNLREQLTDYEDDLSQLASEKETIENQSDTLEAELQVLGSEKLDLNRNLQSKLKMTKVAEQELESMSNNTLSLGKEISKNEELLFMVDMERANILKNCKIEAINLPLKDGLLDYVPIGESADQILKETHDINIDYSLLDENLKTDFNAQTENKLSANYELILDKLEELTPNSKAIERLKEVEKRLKDFDKDFTKARQHENKVIEKFLEIKQRRTQAFMVAFKHISNKIDPIYKELTKSSSSLLGGSAYLTLEDEEEPFNAGIKYHAMPPMKRFRDMELLSGGEKTVAALALLFSVHSYHPSPFFVLDEVDAALDNTNVHRVANYIKNYAGPNFQFIVISLKNTLFERSDALVGIYRDARENSSKTVTLDLRDYEESETRNSSARVSVA